MQTPKCGSCTRQCTCIIPLEMALLSIYGTIQGKCYSCEFSFPAYVRQFFMKTSHLYKYLMERYPEIGHSISLAKKNSVYPFKGFPMTDEIHD
jgi:hypothetical protein